MLPMIRGKYACSFSVKSWRRRNARTHAFRPAGGALSADPAFGQSFVTKAMSATNRRHSPQFAKWPSNADRMASSKPPNI